MANPIEDDEIFTGRLAFEDAQATMAGTSAPFGDGTEYRLGWKDTRLSLRLGSFCVVHEDGPLGELVGDYLRFVRDDGRSVIAYCVASDDLDRQEYDVAVTRRVFAAVESLGVDCINVSVEVMG